MDDYNQQPGQYSYGESTGTGSSPSGTAAGTAARMKEKASQKAANVKDTINEFGQRAVGGRTGAGDRRLHSIYRFAENGRRRDEFCEAISGSVTRRSGNPRVSPGARSSKQRLNP